VSASAGEWSASVGAGEWSASAGAGAGEWSASAGAGAGEWSACEWSACVHVCVCACVREVWENTGDGRWGSYLSV
jgi:hypothetical protein